jgi:glucose-1-phosphate thymidylyltransferase
LIKVAGKPVSQWVVEHLRGCGVTDIVLLLGDNNPTRVVEHFGDGSKLGVKISYVYQGKARGLADAVYRARSLLGDRFLVYLGDNIVLHDLKPLIDFKGSASILLARVPNPNRFGVALLQDGRVVRLVEKPREPVSDLALVGVYAFTDEIFGVIEGLSPSWRGELEITDALQELINRGKNVEYSVVDGWWKDTGTSEDLLEANMMLLDRYTETSCGAATLVDARIQGRVQLMEGVVVKNSTIRGPAYVGKNTVVEDATITPYTSIGDNCVVQHSEVANSIILDDVKITGVSLSDSIIGQGSNIHRNSARLSRLVLGENSTLFLGGA